MLCIISLSSADTVSDGKANDNIDTQLHVTNHFDTTVLINNPPKVFSLLLYVYNVIMNVNNMKGITIMNSKKVRIVTTILYGLTVIGILVKFNMSIFTESIVYLLVGLGGLFLIYTEKDNKLSWTGGVIILLGAIMTLLPVIF